MECRFSLRLAENLSMNQAVTLIKENLEGSYNFKTSVEKHGLVDKA
jgi:hypothetical protein